MTELVIDMRDGGDWSLDLCFAGLVLNLGPENVVDFPRREKHREWDGGYADWGKERRTLGHTPFNHLVRSTVPRDGSLTRVWLDERPESYAMYKGLGLDGVPVVVVAGHDRFWNVSPTVVAELYGKNLEAMLLDNWIPEYDALPFKKRRIGWSCNFNHYWDRPKIPPAKSIDISFIGYNSHPDRKRFVEHIYRRWGRELTINIMLEETPDTMSNFVRKHSYFDTMQRSRICLNLRGGAVGGKAMRAYEIPYVGSYMLSQRIDDPGMEMDFRDGHECDYFSDEDELDDLIWRRLRDVECEFTREEIAADGHRRATEDLSVHRRWFDVLSWLNNG